MRVYVFAAMLVAAPFYAGPLSASGDPVEALERKRANPAAFRFGVVPFQAVRPPQPRRPRVRSAPSRPVLRESVLEQARMRYARAKVHFAADAPAGTLVIDANTGFLYLTRGDGKAERYGIYTVRGGPDWTGRARVSAVARTGCDCAERRTLFAVGADLFVMRWSAEAPLPKKPNAVYLLPQDAMDLERRVAIGAQAMVFGPDSDRRWLAGAMTSR